MATHGEHVAAAMQVIEPIQTIEAMEPVRADEGARWAARARALLELSKPNIAALVVVTALLGFYLGARSVEEVDWVALIYLVVGTALTAAGASALNMVLERDLDAAMMRTRRRPLPSGRVSPEDALAFAVVVFMWGFFELLVFCGPYPALLALATGLTYAFVYTPLKRRGPISLWVGAVPGALPPVMGWAAVRGEIGLGGLSLFAILYVWQFPHFLALACTYREDYARAGFRFLSRNDPEGRTTGRQIVIGCAALLAVGTFPALLGLAGGLYVVGSLVAGGLFLACALRGAGRCTPAIARATFLASIAYLPALLALLVLDRAVS